MREGFILWLYVTGTITFLIIFPLWIINIKSHYNELKNNNAPHPFTVLIKQLAIVNLLLSIFSILPIKFLRVNRLNGRRVWVEWDIRWWTCGSTLAEISEIVKYQTELTLLIKLKNPIEIGSDSKNIEIREVLFKPYMYSSNLIQYFFGMIQGRLFAYKDIEQIKNIMKSECIATCSVVVYQ